VFGWLFGQIMMSILGSVVLVALFDVITKSIIGPLTNAGKNALFVGFGTAITTGLGMVGVKKAARSMRQTSKELGDRIYPVSDSKRLK